MTILGGMVRRWRSEAITRRKRFPIPSGSGSLRCAIAANCTENHAGRRPLSRYKNGLIALFERVHRLQADPTGKRLLALEIQEELLLRIGRAKRVIRCTRNEIDALKCRLAQRGNDRETSRRIKAQRIASE